MLLLASAGASFFPKLKRSDPPGVVPEGFAAVELGVAAPNKVDGVEDEVVAGFAAPPNSEGVPELAPAPDGADWPPNKLLPGGGPAGVVEGKERVLFGAGVAAGVDDPVNSR